MTESFSRNFTTNGRQSRTRFFAFIIKLSCSFFLPCKAQCAKDRQPAIFDTLEVCECQKSLNRQVYHYYASYF